ncbi:hypothetical protein ACFL02_03430 [Planctomycetota bacterium]
MNNNKSTISGSDDQNRPNPRRIFNRILRAAQPHINPFLIDAEHHTARVIMTTRKGIGHKTDVFFNNTRMLLGFVVKFHLADQLSRPQKVSLAKMQNNTIGLSQITFDEETGILNIRAITVLPNSQSVSIVVAIILQEMFNALDDETLSSFLN